MSYILDALRKAEKDRNLGKTPTLGDITSPIARPEPGRTLSPRTLALIVLVLVLAALTVWIWPSHAPTPVTAPVVAAAPALTAPATPAVIDQPLAEVAERAPAEPSEPALHEEVVAETLDDLFDEPPIAANALDAPVAAPGDAFADAPDASEESEDGIDETSAESTSGSEAAEPANADPGTPAELPLLRDMPSDYRAAFPALRVDVHVYDADPARRWAMINGKKAVEDSTLAEGPRVVEITAEGLILDYRGRRTLFPLKR